MVVGAIHLPTTMTAVYFPLQQTTGGPPGRVLAVGVRANWICRPDSQIEEVPSPSSTTVVAVGSVLHASGCAAVCSPFRAVRAGCVVDTPSFFPGEVATIQRGTEPLRATTRPRLLAPHDPRAANAPWLRRCPPSRREIQVLVPRPRICEHMLQQRRSRQSGV